MYWTYTALNAWGEEISSSISGNKQDILRQLSVDQIQIIEIKLDYKRSILSLYQRKKISTLMMATLFKDFNSMLETGMSVPQALGILKETSQDELLKHMLFDMEMNLRQGKSLTEIFIELKSFPWIVAVSLSAGERAGKLSQTVGSLGEYFQKSYLVQNRIKQALIYPVIVAVVLILLMLFMSLKIIPQLKNLLPDQALHNPVTQGLLTFSFFIQNFIWLFILSFVLFVVGIFYLGKKRATDFQMFLYRLPCVGEIIKESALALYLLNLSVLLRSGIPLLKSINDLNSLNQSPVARHFEKVREYIIGGSSFWQAIEEDKFFPKIVSATLRRGEEMTKIEDYCFSLSEFFQKRINSKMDTVVDFIQPTMLAIGGAFLVVIAIGFLMPIYGSLTTVAGGQ